MRPNYVLQRTELLYWTPKIGLPASGSNWPPRPDRWKLSNHEVWVLIDNDLKKKVTPSCKRKSPRPNFYEEPSSIFMRSQSLHFFEIHGALVWWEIDPGWSEDNNYFGIFIWSCISCLEWCLFILSVIWTKPFDAVITPLFPLYVVLMNSWKKATLHQSYAKTTENTYCQDIPVTLLYISQKKNVK